MQSPVGIYSPFQSIKLTDRQWPNNDITAPPRWVSVDLRDGNQALFNPMGSAAKMKYFDMLTKIGFKEIEIGFPSASDTEDKFTRKLIEEGHVPDDVTIQVLTQARPDLIDRTMEAIRGARSAILHVYTATSPQFRELVLNKTKPELIAFTLESIDRIREQAEKHGTGITLEYSPEHFTSTELPYALEMCNAVTRAWGIGPDRKVILNLPATVEVCRPNQYADMIEYMGRHLENREHVAISLHPHNDRGTAVAAVEMGLQAGADRVEGCLFGNGERTGNVDLVTLAMNMYTQGVDPGLDFSNLDEIAHMVSELTEIPVHPRHPHAGEMVDTAFSGSHQDAIRKTMAAQKPGEPWNVAYLPRDPKAVGRDYRALIRVNSQSGKGGIAYILEQQLNTTLPRKFQIEFSSIVQKHADATGEEVSDKEILQLFKDGYTAVEEPIKYRDHNPTAANGNEPRGIWMDIDVGGESMTKLGQGNGPIDATVNALGLPINIIGYEEKAMGTGSNAQAISFIEISIANVPGSVYGVAIDGDTGAANVKAVINAVNRAIAQDKLALPASFKSDASPVNDERLSWHTTGGQPSVALPV